MSVSAVVFALAVIFGLMLSETRISRRHERRLRARGAVEPRGDVYAAMSIAYPAAFLLMGAEGVWRASQSAAPPDGPAWFASGVLMFAAAKGLKYWAIGSLGELWSFRVLILPGQPLVRTGPYAYIGHPNYLAIVGELVGTAMMVRAAILGPVMLVTFGILLWMRLRLESRELHRLADPG